MDVLELCPSSGPYQNSRRSKPSEIFNIRIFGRFEKTFDGDAAICTIKEILASRTPSFRTMGFLTGLDEIAMANSDLHNWEHRNLQ